MFLIFFVWGIKWIHSLNYSTENENNFSGMSVWCNSEHFRRGAVFFSKAKQASWDKTVSLEVAIWLLGRVIRVLILTQINDKKSFQTISPFLTGSSSFYFLHNNTTSIFYVCKYRDILCLKIIDTKERPVLLGRISYFRSTHPFWPQQSTQSKKGRLTFFTFQNYILTGKDITKTSTWNINIDPTKLPTKYLTSLYPGSQSIRESGFRRPTCPLKIMTWIPQIWEELLLGP